VRPSLPSVSTTTARRRRNARLRRRCSSAIEVQVARPNATGDASTNSAAEVIEHVEDAQ